MESLLRSHFCPTHSQTLTSLSEKKERAVRPTVQIPEPRELNDSGNHSRYIEVVNYMYQFATTLG